MNTNARNPFVRWFAPNEFAIRGWRRCIRRRSWWAIPQYLLPVVVLFLLLSVPIFWGVVRISRVWMLLFVFGQSTLVYGLSVMIAGLWWARPSTRSTLMELAVTPTSPFEYIRSTLLPVRVIMVVFVVVLSVPLLLQWYGFAGREGGTFLAAWLGNIVCSWLNIPLAVTLILCSRSVGGGVAKASAILLPFNYFFLAVILIVCLRIQYLHSEVEFVVHQVIASSGFVFVTFWMRKSVPVAFAQAVERLIEKA